MRSLILPLVLACGAACAAPPNPLIDYDGFARDVADVGKVRESRRVSEEDFIRMAREPGTVVLDARSERLFRLRHVDGAVNLSFPEFTQESLARVIPSPGTRVLIYCNNNFRGAMESMPTKAIGSASTSRRSSRCIRTDTATSTSSRPRSTWRRRGCVSPEPRCAEPYL